MLFAYFLFFLFNATATTEIYTLSLHDALPIYLVVARIVEVEVLPHAGSDRRDHGPDLLVREDLVDPGLLHVEDLAAEGQDRLIAPVPRLLRRAARRVAFDQEHLAQLRVGERAVGELAGKQARLETALFAHQLARLARRFTRPRRADRLRDDGARDARALVEEIAQRVVHYALHDPFDFRVAELRLGLALELGVLHLDVQHRGQALPHVVAGERELLLLEESVLLRPFVDRAGQGGAEPGEVGAALVRVDVVDEAEGVVVVTVVVLDRALDLDSLPLGLERDRFRVQRLAVAEQVLHELGEPALVDERLFLQRALALVLERDGEALVQEGELAQPGGEGGVVEPSLREDRGVRLEPDGRAGALRLADHLELLRRLAALERHVMALAVAVHPHLQLLRQRVDYGDPHPVQPARHLVGRLVELAAGVEHRQRHLDARLLFGLVNVDRDAAAVVDDRDRVVGVDRHVDARAVTCQRLVHRVIHDLVDEVVQAARRHRPDVHGRAAPHRLQPLQDLDRVGLVVARIGLFGGGGLSFRHSALACEKPAYRPDPSCPAAGVARGHDLRRPQLQFGHPRARRDTHEQRTVRRHALGVSDCSDLRSDEREPVGDDLRLRQPPGQPRPGEVVAERVSHRHRLPLLAIPHPLPSVRGPRPGATEAPGLRLGASHTQRATGVHSPNKILRSHCQGKTY